MIYLVLIVAFFVGYYLREVLNTLKRLEARIELLRRSESKSEAPKASFAEPMTRAEAIALLEQERVDALNG